jgi:thiamine pyrophosphate-dependent acetolactate synthase large subunit-like protein
LVLLETPRLLDRAMAFLLMPDIQISWRLPRALGGMPKLSQRKKDLESALKRLIDSDGPALLDVQVPYQEQVLPMIPSGMSVRELIKK